MIEIDELLRFLPLLDKPGHDGHWGNLLKKGRIVALLKHLETIRSE